MNAGLREHLELLRRQGMLWDIEEPVDLRYASALIAGSDKAVLLRHPQGYDSQCLVGGLFSDPARTAVAYGWPFEEAWQKVRDAEKRHIAPVAVGDSPAWEVVSEGASVDLTALPLLVLATRDGAPYISAGITACRDPGGGNNWGVYRYQLAGRTTLLIDLASFNNLHAYLERAYAEGRTFGVTVCLGNHPVEFLSAAMNAPAGVDEMGFAGSLRGEPVELVRGASVDAMAIANSEYILEGEFLPGGWVHDEGRFGEFHHLMGSMYRNPALWIKRVARRRDAHLYELQMSREVNWLNMPLTQWAAHKALLAAGQHFT